MPSSTVLAVNGLKEALGKATADGEGSDSTERISDILSRLDELPIDLKVLTDTLIGAAVSKVKASHPNSELSAQAKALVKKWKKAARDGGIGKTKLDQGGSGSAAAPLPPKKHAGTEGLHPSSAEAPAENGNAAAEFSHLPLLRKNISVKLHSILVMSKAELTSGEDGLDGAAINELALSRAGEVENAIQVHSRGEKTAYTGKARSLCFNLKKNDALRSSVLLGQTSGKEVTAMSADQLATSEKAKARADLVEDLRNSRRLDWEQANEKKINEQCGIKGDLLKASLFTCGRCKSIKTTSTQKQTRSADEPMTVFVLCLNCNNRWKC